MATDGGMVVWKHIGLHGHSVGTFACDDKKIVWKSAISGRDSSSTSVDDDGQMEISTFRTIPALSLTSAKWTVFGKSGIVRIQTKGGSISGSNNTSNLKHEYRFDGFPPNDFDTLKDTLSAKYNINLQQHNMSAAGTQYGLTNVNGKNLLFRHCILDEMNEEGQEFEPRAMDEMLSLDLAEVSQCVLPGNNRNEIEVQFPESDTVEAGTDQLVAIRMYIPPDPDSDPADKEAPTAAELLQQRIMQTANIRKTTGDVLVSFEQQKGAFLTPRGRYAIELYDSFLRMRGMKYDYKIRYDDINRLFLLPKPDEAHMAFVIALDKPIRQGQQRYQYLVMQASKEPDEVTVNLDEETLQKEYEGELQPVMRGSLSNLIAKTFKVIARKKVFIPGKFANANQQTSLSCSVRANEGLLYPLEKQFVFIHKPPIIVRFNEIESVEFQRYAGGQGSTRNFDFCVNLKTSAYIGTVKDYTFSGIDRADYAALYSFISGKKIPIKNLQGAGFLDEDTSEKKKAPVYNEDEIFGLVPGSGGAGGGGDDDDDDGSDDEEYDENAAAEDMEPDSSDDSEELDDDEMGSEVDEELDSDLEEHRGDGGSSKRKKDSTPKKKKKKADSDDDNDDEEDTSPKKKKAKATNKKKTKDKNAPKKPMSGYFFFMNESRDRIKADNPDAAFGEIGKIAGAEWNKLSDDKKKKYEQMAEKDKVRYQNDMKDYTPPVNDDDDGDDDNDNKKSKSKKTKKDPNAPKRPLTSYIYFSNEMRPKLRKEKPDMPFGELGKKLSEMFRALSSTEKEKYEQLAKNDQARYKKEMTDFNKNSNTSTNKSTSSTKKKSTSTSSSSSSKIKSKDDKKKGKSSQTSDNDDDDDDDISDGADDSPDDDDSDD